MPADEMRGPIPPSDPGSGDEFDEGVQGGSEADDRRERNVRAIVAAIILIIVVILVLLLLRTCGTTTKRGNAGDKTIVAVPTQVRSDKAVSVWVKPGASLTQILSSAGIRATSTRSMGEGLYFVFLPDGEQANTAVARLKRDDRVHDAGFVYDQGQVEPH